MESFIRKMPKAELGVQLEGTFEPELLFRIANNNGIKLPFHTVKEISNAYLAKNSQEFSKIYNLGIEVLHREQDFYDLTWAYLQRAKQNNIRYTEISFDPQAHTRRGVSFGTILHGIHHALEDAKEKLHISSNLIMRFLRSQSEESAMQMLNEALRYKRWFVAVSLDFNEKANPPLQFRNVFTIAREQGWFAEAYMGEEASAEYISQVLNQLHVSRVDNAIHSLDNQTLLAELIEKQIAVTVYPLSNVKFGHVPALKDHPIKKMLDKKLLVSINSGFPAFLSGYLADNLLAVQKALDLSKKDIYHLVKNAFLTSFVSEVEKAVFINDLDGFCTKY